MYGGQALCLVSDALTSRTCGSILNLNWNSNWSLSRILNCPGHFVEQRHSGSPSSGQKSSGQNRSWNWNWSLSWNWSWNWSLSWNWSCSSVPCKSSNIRSSSCSNNGGADDVCGNTCKLPPDILAMFLGNMHDIVCWQKLQCYVYAICIRTN
jgi:hypothetical protein